MDPQERRTEMDVSHYCQSLISQIERSELGQSMEAEPESRSAGVSMVPKMLLAKISQDLGGYM